jgi:hypothetical protein
MKRLQVVLFVLLMLAQNLVLAQRTIRGTVTLSSNDKPIQGVLVSTGKIGVPISRTDEMGQFQINIPSGITALRLSKKGLITLETGISASFIYVEMEEMQKSIDQSVPDTITAKGRWKIFVNTHRSDSVIETFAETGYEVVESGIQSSSLKQVVDGDNLNPAHQLNVNNLLAGKAAGLKIYGQSGMALGRTGSISLRGPTGFSAGEGPVYYVDGTLISDINYITYSEIESVTVLNGPASAAFTGSDGRNGAVLIRTKDGKNVTPGSGFVVNTGVQFSTVNMLPAYQDRYSGGAEKDLLKYVWKVTDPGEWKPLDGKYYHDYGDDSSWGPLMTGQEYIPWYAWYPGTEYTGKTAKLNPQPDNVRRFYDTGIRLNNSLNFYNKTENVYFSGTLGHINEKGNIPYTSLNKYFLALKAKFDLSKRLSFETSFNYFTTLQSGEIDDNYSNITTGAFNSWYHRDLESEKMREFIDYRVPGTKIMSTWNHGNPTYYDQGNPSWFYSGYYWHNAYTYLKTIGITNRTDRLSGKISIKYKINEIFSSEITFRGENRYLWNEEKVPQYSYSGAQRSYDWQNYYLSGSGYTSRDNLSAIIRAEKQFTDFSFDFTCGADLYWYILKSNSSRTYGGLIIPELYAIENSRYTPGITNTRTESQSRSLFARGAGGYKDILFIDAVLRREWHSTLPAEDNAFNVKSIGGSFIFSKLIKLPFTDLGKIRASWGQIPSALKPYQYPGMYYGRNQYTWNGNDLTETPNTVTVSNLKGSVKSEWETGVDLVLLKNRISAGFTSWMGKEEGIPVTGVVAAYSGFTTRTINSGIIERKGYDIILSGTPFLNSNFEWRSSLIFSKLSKYDVVKIADGVEKITVQTLWGTSAPSMNISEGQPWGVLYGSGMKTKDGIPLLQPDGKYVSDPNKNFGSVYPDITGGFQNEFRIWKAFKVNINIDYQYGGRFFSQSHMWGTFSGLTARTADLNDRGFPVRLPVAEGGGVHVTGIDKNTQENVGYYIDGQDYFHSLYNDKICDSFVFDASYIKLRELSLSYYFSFGKYISKAYIKGLELTLYSENIWMIWAAQRNFDPSELSYTSGERAQFPSVRSIGTNIRFVF